jgi:hypothetical protein
VNYGEEWRGSSVVHGAWSSEFLVGLGMLIVISVFCEDSGSSLLVPWKGDNAVVGKEVDS